MNTPADGPMSPKWGLRCLLGGALMGLANLVPGISGGTMLLAAGIYPRFIQALADLSGLRLRKNSLLVLGLVGIAAAAAILLGAGPVKDAVVEHRWAMYSLFIGLTLGGVPVLWQMARPATGPFWVGTVAGLLVMAGLAWLQVYGATSGASREGIPMMFVAGVAGASAMILPGVSGGYLLLVLGVYVPVLSAVDALKEALKANDLASATDPFLGVVLPVGIGVAIGILVISKWPFQEGVAPKVGEIFKGQVLTAERLAELGPEKFPTEFFAPTFSDVMMAVGLVGVGYMVTTLVAHVGGTKPKRR